MDEPHILCISSYEKGADFLDECARLGRPALLLTVEALKDAAWPRHALADLGWLPDLTNREHVIHGVSWLARTRRLGRIVALDEFDLEMAATLREHLRIPGMGETAVRYFRDKLAMRQITVAAGVRVPAFCALFHDDDVRAFTARVAPPWLLKPRLEAASVGIRKVMDATTLETELDALGDRRSFFLLEAFEPGTVYHVDSIVDAREIRFAAASRYATPPFDVAHAGGLFSSRTVACGTDEERDLLDANAAVIRATGMIRGALHTEFIRADSDGSLVFVETAARVGGAYIVEMIEAARGVNLWREWARAEIANMLGQPYPTPVAGTGNGGIVLSLSRQEWPDTSGYTDAEIVYRVKRRHHAGLIVASPEAARVEALLDSYVPRFQADFLAVLPAADRPTA